MSSPNWRSSSRTPVGLVTLISVTYPPMTSRPIVEPAADALGPGGEIAPVVGRGRDAGEAVGYRLAVHEDHARVARLDDVRDVTLHDGVPPAVLGERLEHHVGVLVARLEHEDRAAAHAVERLADRPAVLAQERVHVRHVARDERRCAALREPGRVHLLVHVAQALRPVHDQRTGSLGAFEDVRRVDVLGVEWRVLAHQDHVEVAEPLDLRLAAREPVARVVPHLDRVRAAHRHTVAQPQAAEFEVRELPAAS